MGIFPFLVALLVQIGMPLISSHHLACNSASCTTPVGGGSPAVASANSDTEDGVPPAKHDHLTCQICHLILAAQSLLSSVPDSNGSPVEPQADLCPGVTMERPGRAPAAAFLVRAPPLCPPFPLV